MISRKKKAAYEKKKETPNLQYTTSKMQKTSLIKFVEK